MCNANETARSLSSDLRLTLEITARHPYVPRNVYIATTNKPSQGHTRTRDRAPRYHTYLTTK